MKLKLRHAIYLTVVLCAILLIGHKSGFIYAMSTEPIASLTPEPMVTVAPTTSITPIPDTNKPQSMEYTGKITLNQKKVSLQQGKTYQLKATLTDEDSSGKSMGYLSSDKKIVTVTDKGLITAVHYGTATVTVSLGKAQAKCKVTVSKDVKITINAAGDCTFSSDIKMAASTSFYAVYKKQKDNAYFFKNVKPIFEKDDMTIVNFEGTLSKRGTRAIKTWAFRGKPSYIDILKQGSIEAVAFANNHSYDYGKISYTDTVASFKKADIAYSSYTKVGIYKVKGVRIGMISIQQAATSEDYKATLRKAIKAMKKKKPDLLIVSFHWGVEYTFSATKIQKELSRIAIKEGGADLVLGHHPHVIQGIERYKGTNIVYSMGNFCFGGNSNPPDKDSIIYQQTFTFHNDKLVSDMNAKIIPCKVSSVTTRNNYQPTPCTGKDKKHIIERMKKYSKVYEISFNKNGKLIVK